MQIRILLFSAILFFSWVSNAQGRRGRHQSGSMETISYEVGLGLSNYYGDLCDGFGGCLQPRIALGGGIYYKINPIFSLKADLNYYRLASKDYHESRGVQMRSGNLELFTALTVSFNTHDGNYGHKNAIVPFVFFGLGATYFNPSIKTDSGWETLGSLEPNGASGSNMALILPVGGGIKIHHDRYTDLVFEFGYRFAMTDYLDGLSEDNIDPSTISDETKELIPSLAEGVAGNPDKKDGYWIFMVKYKHTPHVNKSKHKSARKKVRR